MHQTFYIDIDEEITSIVDKLRKTKAPEVIMVVPKRALLIQSIVNLKLLRKEADSLGVKISIITQDKLGKLLVGKAGISLQQKIDDDLEEMEIASSESDNKKKDVESSMFNANTQEVSQNKRRLDRIGSSEYFSGSSDGIANINDEVENFEKNKITKVKNIPVYSKKIERDDFNPLSDVNINDEIPERKRPISSSMDVAKPSRPIIQKNSTKTSFVPEKKDNQYFQEHSLQQNTSNKDEQLEHFFYANNFSERKNDDFTDEESDGRAFGFFAKLLFFCLVIVLIGGSAYAAFIYIPKATITIFAKKEIKSSTISVTVDVAQSSIDYEKSIIPAKILNFDETVSETFDTTESKNVSEQKAKGKVTIYNEFSSAPQPLVATTRFLSEDQKIFRLIQGVTVPGTTKIGNEIKPGVVEVEVVADEAGDSYNIGPTNFSIPGFKDSGSEKHSKIYAKSTQAMTGGGKGNGSVRVISEKDISAAKDKLSLKVTDTIKKKIKDSAESGTIILDKAISLEDPIYEVSGSAGEIADTFEIKVQSKAKALVFLESDIKTLANSIVAKSGNGKVNMDSSALIIDYGKVNADFNLGTASIEVLASSVIQPNFNLDDLRKGFLGKNNEELATYLRNYAEIEKAEVEYWPPVFVSKIPDNEKRVEIKLDYITP